MKKITIFLLISFSLIFAQKTYIPDDKFEQALIGLGYDTTLDDSVLTDVDVNVADIGTGLGRLLHRRRGESHTNPKSVPFRAWLRHRLEISGRVVEAASKGQVNPTPSAKMCSYCPVKMSCGLDIAFKGGFS